MTSRGALAALALTAALAAASLPAALSVQPRLQCVCTSTHFDDVSFSITCERNVTGSWPQQGDIFTEHSEVSCKRGPVPAPGPEYRLMGDLGYYKFHPRQATWEDALRTCAREGANLAVVNSDAEAEAMASLFAEFPRLHEEGWLNDQAWVGVTDLAKEGDYRTLRGETLEEAGWETWSENEPNNEGDNEHCIAMERDKVLNDEPCDTKLAFWCERRQ